MNKWVWARFAEDGYELSTVGDMRFSALTAQLSDGRTIEEAYQLDIKGYRLHGDSWRLGKGKRPLFDMTKDETWAAYLGLWERWANENPALIADLRRRAEGRTLTDQYAKTDISQARALAEILNR